MLTLPKVDRSFIHGNEHSRVLEEFLTKHKREFENQLIGDLSHINHRADNLNGIEIKDVQHQSGNEYCLNYSYDWFVYNGCADMDEQDNEDGSVHFTIEANGEIEFEVPEFEERTTYNEF